MLKEIKNFINLTRWVDNLSYFLGLILPTSRNKYKNAKLILDTTTDAIHILDINGNLLDWNAAFEKHLGYNKQELTGINVRVWDSGFSEEELKFTLKKNIEKINHFKTKHTTKDGKIRDVEVQSFGIDDHGKILMYCSARDITERLKTETELLNSETRYRSLFELNKAVMLLVDPKDGRLLDVNPAAESFYGWSREELKRKTIFEINTNPQNVSRANMQAVAEKRNQSFKRQHRLANGTLRDVEVFSTPIELPNSSDQYLFSIIHDITENVQNEKLIKEQQIKVIEANRLALLGQMAQGMAHEINNPLTIIKGLSYGIQQDLEKLPEESLMAVIKKLEKINANIDRISQIISALRDFSQTKQNECTSKVNVREQIERIKFFFQEKFKEREIDFSIQFRAESNIEFNVDENKISQVLINLLNNAYDAIEKVQCPIIKIEVMIAANNKVAISVIDNGHGVVKEDVTKIMDPFFTTKSVGKGAGLGLSISKGIVEKHGGRLYLDCECEMTKFTMELPQAS